MTHLRQQLLDLQSEYAAARYPGDLAARLLKPERPRLNVRLFMGWTASVVAACLALAVLIYDPAADAVQDGLQRITQSAVNLSFGGEPAPAPGEGFSISPEIRTIDVPLPLAPEFPGFSSGSQESA